MKNTRSRGFSLLEVLVAAVLVGIGSTAMLTLANLTITNAGSTGRIYEGSDLARNLVEQEVSRGYAYNAAASTTVTVSPCQAPSGRDFNCTINRSASTVGSVTMLRVVATVALPDAGMKFVGERTSTYEANVLP